MYAGLILVGGAIKECMITGQLTFESYAAKVREGQQCRPTPVDQYRLARMTDPPTSFQATEKLRKSGKLKGQRKAVLRALNQNNGATSAELSKAIGPDRYLASRRLCELERGGLVKRGRIRLCTVTKSRYLTWWILDNGRT